MPPSTGQSGTAVALFEDLAERSAVVHGNRTILPVAAWLAETALEVVSAPEVVRGLAGQIAPNKALDALARLGEIGAVTEMPHPGRPQRRTFVVAPSPYWDFVKADIEMLAAEAGGA